jgi:cytochrome c556
MNARYLMVPLTALALTAATACGGKPPLDPALEKAMQARHDGFEQIGDSMKKITDTLKGGGSLDPALVDASHTINGLAPQLKDWFPPGSGPETGRKTAAKPEIWTQPDEFARKREIFVSEATKLAQLADASDAAGFAAQVPKLGQACKGCHEQFRKKDKN